MINSFFLKHVRKIYLLLRNETLTPIHVSKNSASSAFCLSCVSLLESSHNRPSSPRSPHQANPRGLHTVAAIAVFGLSCIPLWLGFQYYLAEVVTWLLSYGQISVTRLFSAGTPVLIISLSDGSKLSLLLTFQRCGLVSVTIFGFLWFLLLHFLEASMLRKIMWLEIGLLIGLGWSFLRLSLSLLISYQFGSGALAVVDFLISPFADVFWAVATWSLALSALTPKAVRR